MTRSIVLRPGVRWTDIPGTDRRLAVELGRRLRVLWVDPPVPLHRSGDLRGMVLQSGAAVDEVSPGVLRLRVIGPPGFTRPGLRALAERRLQGGLSRALGELRLDPIATVLSAPLGEFPRRTRMSGARVLYLTDDWVGGAGMLGVTADTIADRVRRNAAAADLVAAITPALLDTVRAQRTLVLPNGCDVPPVPRCLSAANGERARSAVLVGQLNERIDVRMLAAVVDSGIPVTVAGPRTERDPACRAALDGLLSRAGVTYLGPLPADEIPQVLADATVGLTPYADTAFNRRSFPLKTLEYLAAGLAVVSTALPATALLDTPLIRSASGADEFTAAVRAALDDPPEVTAELVARRRAFAAEHSWSVRAESLLAAIDRLTGGSRRVVGA